MVKPGYKQSEVGVIPEDWAVKPLASYWSVTDCKHVTAQFTSSGYPVASIREVQSRFVDLNNAKSTNQKFYNQLIEGGRKPKSGDLIISRNATVGEVAQVAEWHPDFAMGQDVCLLRKNTSACSSDFLQSLFRSPIIEKQISDAMVGSTFKRVNVEQIRNLVVPMPEADEQQAIAAALSDADELIGSLEQLLTKKRQIKQGAMQELLTGKKRLPGFTGEWEVKKLGDLGKTFGGLTGKTKSDFGIGNGKYITFMNVMTNVVIDEDTFEKVRIDSTENQNRVMKGDLLFNGSSETPEEVAMCALLDTSLPDLYLNSFCFGFRFYQEGQFDGLFMAYLLRSTSGRKLMTLLAQGSTRYNLSKGEFMKTTLPLPSLSEQTAIAEVLYDMDAEIEALETKLTKARQVKQGMMQELLTGRIRLV